MRNFLRVLLALAILFCSPAAQAQVVPSYSKSFLTFGDYSNARPCPTSGTLTGVYKTSGNWVQTGPITANMARLYFGGSVTFNNTVTVSNGIEGNTGGQGPMGICAINSGAGGSHAGSGGTYPGYPGPGPVYGYPWFPLAGCGGSPLPPNGGGVNGNGGGGFYVEALGPVSLTSSAAISARGADASGGAGAGAGGGIDIRSMSTITIASGATISAIGGNETISGNGGGGGGGLINLESAKASGVTNSGTLSVTGGTGGASNPGGAGTIFNGTIFEGPRLGY